MEKSPKSKNAIFIILRLIVIIIFIIGGTNKVGSTQESIDLFKELGVEPWGRYLLGIAELVIAVMIAISRTVCLGALSSALIMVGAIGTHIFKTEIDGMFFLALVAFLASVGILWMKKCCYQKCCGCGKGGSSDTSKDSDSTKDE